MKKHLCRLLALVLVCLMLVQTSQVLIAEAVESVDKALHPTEQIELRIPQELQDGKDYFFIRENGFSISEKSGEKLYIPIQRAGNLSAEAEVTLKLVDVTSRHDVNYTAEIYREQIKPETVIADMSLLELALNADAQEEFETPSQDEMGQLIYDQGGAEVVDAEGNTIGELTAYPVDENGEPVEETDPADPEAETDPAEKQEAESPAAEEETGKQAEAAPVLEADESVTEGEWSTDESATSPLRKARDQFTGTVSDRQEMAAKDDILLGSKEEAEEPELVEDSYPGKEYRLHFDAGEEAKYLVITPLYSEAADGDCQLMLMLKDPDAEQQIPQDFFISAVVIADEDEHEPAVIRMAEELINAENGKVTITVERQGMINSIVGAHLSSWGGSAVMGEDYGGVGADLLFPMGITSRSIELPVEAGTEMKDFYVTLTPIENVPVQIESATTHIIIPAADQEVISRGLLRDNAANENVKLGDKLNLRDLKRSQFGEHVKFEDDGFKMVAETPDDEEYEWAGMSWNLNPGYFYDGYYTEYDYELDDCDGRIEFETWSKEKGSRIYGFDDDDSGWHRNKSTYFYYAETKTPYAASVAIENTDNEGWPWTDDCAKLVVKSVQPIYRRFVINMEKPVMADGSQPYFPGTDEKQTKQYCALQFNKNDSDTCTIWGGDNFSVSQIASQTFVRLVAVEAVKSDGTTYRIGSNDGTSQSVVTYLTESLVNKLAADGYITWSKGPGGPKQDSNSKQGTFTIRPVFEYIFVDVEVKENQFGNLLSETPVAPTLLWDFNSDMILNGRMGNTDKGDVSWKGGIDYEGNDYYTFTAEGVDPRVSMDIPSARAQDMTWAKVRAKNVSGADAIELFGKTGGKSLAGTDCVHVDLVKDDQWHTYIINVPEENIRTANTIKGGKLTTTRWVDKVDFIRLDPMWKSGDGGMTKGEQIEIDYIAFFSSREGAQAFRPDLDNYDNTPSILWDFNADGAISASMGKNQRARVNWESARDEQTGDEYYLFTATGSDPYVSMDLSAPDARNVAWAKIRAKNLSGADAIELFGKTGGKKLTASDCARVVLEKDQEWHTYLINVPEENIRTTNLEQTNWNGNVEWIRLDPMWSDDSNTAGTVKDGSQIAIDYVAFFSTREAAEGFRGEKDLKPTLIFDFNNNKAMNQAMGQNTKNGVKWSAQTDVAGNDYYVFTAESPDPYVSLDVSANAADLVWAKVRARNVSAANAIELYGSMNGQPVIGEACVHVDLEQDEEWHTYLINIPEENVHTANTVKNANLSETVWKGEVSWVRVDPMWKSGDGSMTSGDKIEIDYIAFFSDKEAAEAFRTEGSGNGKTVRLEPGNYRFHLGDLMMLYTELTPTGEVAGLTGSGFRFDLFVDRNGEFIDGAAKPYINGIGQLKLRGLNEKGDLAGNFYRLQPTFSHTANQVVVQIAEEDLQDFNLDKGIFATTDKWLEDGVWYYRIGKNVRSNEIFELAALAKDPTHVPIWKSAQDNGTYSGYAFYLMSSVYPEDNVVRLTLDRNPSSHAYYDLYGYTYTTVMNLSSGRESGVMVPAKDALVTAGITAALSDENGDFRLPAQYLMGNTTVRYTVTYNGTVNICEARLAPAGAKKQDALYTDPYTGQVSNVQAIPVSLNTVDVAPYSVSGAHFVSASVDQGGTLEGVLNTADMNGQQAVFTVQLNPGDRYVYNNEVLVENIKDVTLFFQNQTTKEIHGEYSIHDKPDPLIKGKIKWDPATLTVTLTFGEFTPDNPSEYIAGDVLMLQLTTDKKVGLASIEGQQMTYDPVSSGIAVVTDLDYKPKKFDYQIPNVANLVQILGPNESGSGTGSDYSFGRLPFLGEVTTGLKILTMVVNRAIGGSGAKNILKHMNVEADQNAQNNIVPLLDDDLSDDDDDEWIGEEDDLWGEDYEPEDDGLGGDETIAPKKSWNISMAFTLDKTFYGGFRFMVAVVATYKVFDATTKNLTNPYKDGATAWEFFTNGRYAKGINGKEGEQLIFNNAGYASKGEELRAMYGGGHFHIGLYIGVYLDFGLIKRNADGTTAGVVFMGAGGFFGAQANLGYTWYTTIFGIPVYINPEASADITFYIGASADPTITLKNFRQGDLSGEKFGFNFEYCGKITAGITIGVGIYKILGARVAAAFSFESGYALGMAEWYPEIGTNWGFTTDISFKGSIDFVVGSIDLVDYSWPGPWNGGWMYTLSEVRRANNLLTFVKNGIAKNRGSLEARSTAQNMADELKAMVNYRQDLSTEPLVAKTKALKKYAYDHDIITWTEKNRVEMNRQGGLIGGIMEDYQFGDYGKKAAGGESVSSEKLMPVRTRNHVQSKWVAGENAQLMSAFQPVHSETLMENAYAQTSSQILNIGDNHFLVVFLDDDNTRDRQQAGTLKWTVYDATNDTWTAPQTVQDDGTVDGKPNLVKAGDKAILSWASIAAEKYEALKAEVAAQLAELNNGVAPSDVEIQMELEADPARVMAKMDIFTATFDKDANTFGEIEQLTDDEYYDDSPQAVYDEDTGDYIVLYYKTAQDDEAYTDSRNQLLDLAGIGADPDKTYALLGYMLYNNQTEAKDTAGKTHQPGWARDYLFANETDQTLEEQAEFLADWGGQRFLPTSVKGMSDPPIGDLTAGIGYNGLAAYAFTVDKDYDLSTGEDKDLYVQFYRFSDHKTYVPIKIAGEQNDNGFVTAVDVGAPKLVRNSGNTWLFWRENETGLKYLNVSEMLNAKVASVQNPGEDDWTWAVREDGSFAVDAESGETYEPDIMPVDFGSMMTDEAINATDYQVITDNDDNLYVVWTDTITFVAVDEVTGEKFQQTAHEIYMSAMVKEEADFSGTVTDVETEQEVAGTGSGVITNWSKPYRLTRENNYNDGVSIALDDNGGLILIHNQYDVLLADSEEEVEMLLENGQLAIREDGEKKYAVGSFWYNSPIRLMVTRCDAVGSLEATTFRFSHNTPVPGEVIEIYTAIENVGLTTAHGCVAEFYEYKNGKRVRLVAKFDVDEEIHVNDARMFSFMWMVPKGGVEGRSFQAVISEKKPDGTAYEPTITYSDPFETMPAYELTLDSFAQNGDVFDAQYTVVNTGNAPAPEGTTTKLVLSALYGDLKDQYGMDDDVLISEDISGLKPRETRVITKSITLPVSVFDFCGYDAVQAAIYMSNGIVLTESEQRLICMDGPMNAKLNNGKAMNLSVGAQRKADVTFDTNLFLAPAEVVYTVADPDVASVDKDGKVTGLSDGVTTLTATILPSGRTTSVDLRVGEAAKNPFEDVKEDKYYYDAVLWAYYHVPQITAGTSSTRFSPNGDATRAQVVTFLWRAAGEPEPASMNNPFTDVAEGKYYTKAVLWAVEQGITKGTSATAFSPDKTCNRGEFVTFLYRFAKTPQFSSTTNPFTDVEAGRFYYEPVMWAVENEITAGTSATTFSPAKNCTRGQIVTFLWRYMAE